MGKMANSSHKQRRRYLKLLIIKWLTSLKLLSIVLTEMLTSHSHFVTR